MRAIVFLLVYISSIAGTSQDTLDSVGFGLLPPTKEQLRYLAYAAAALDSSDIPKDSLWDLSSQFPPAGRQGRQGSCVAWAMGYALKGYYENKKRKWGFESNEHLFSPSFVFGTLKNGNEPCLCRDGVHFIDVFDLMYRQGCCRMSVLPYNSSVISCCSLPSSQAFADARNYRIATPRPQPVPKDVGDFKYYLRSGVPIIIGIYVDEAFRSGGFQAGKSHNEFLWAPAPGSPSIGYHAMLCVGYDDTRQLFKVLNSYGLEWGRDGYCHIPYKALLDESAEAYVAMDMRMPGAAPDTLADETAGRVRAIGDTLYRTWVKAGYYRTIAGLRLGAIAVDPDSNEVLFTVADSLGSALNSFILRPNQPITFSSNTNTFLIDFERIGKAGKTNKPALYFAARVRGYTEDRAITLTLNQVEQGEYEVQQWREIRDRQEQHQRQQQQLQQQQQQQLRRP